MEKRFVNYDGGQQISREKKKDSGLRVHETNRENERAVLGEKKDRNLAEGSKLPAHSREWELKEKNAEGRREEKERPKESHLILGMNVRVE